MSWLFRLSPMAHGSAFYSAGSRRSAWAAASPSLIAATAAHSVRKLFMKSATLDPSFAVGSAPNATQNERDYKINFN